MKNLILESPIVDAEFLFDYLDADNLIILDATKAMPGQKDFVIPQTGICGARFINLKEDFADSNSDLPNMLLSEKDFTKAAQKLGVNSNSAIVVYDQTGIYSSPRVYWMFKAMGHENIAVLDGGFASWEEANLHSSLLNLEPISLGNFVAVLDPKLIATKEFIFDSLDKNTAQILDARSAGRFNGTDPEPRAIIRSGHIPNSCSLPHTILKQGGKFLSKEKLKKQFDALLSNDNRIVFSCGSGITACILFLAAEIIGYEDIAVYDGSWSEWGLPSDLPVAL